MVVLAVLSGLLLGAAVAWPVALAWAHAEVGRVRARMQDQIGYWQDQAERATASAARVAERTAAWVAGCQQGREDTLLLARALARRGPEAGEGSADG
jgi:hypothetical protein